MDLATQRRMTKAFIDQLPVQLVLTPQTKRRQPAGGWVFQKEAPRDVQTFTIIETSGPPTPTVTLDGIERRVEMELLGEHTAQLAIFDLFTHQGKDWEVVNLFYDNGYEIRAWVSARG